MSEIESIEIKKLENLLTENNIPFTKNELFGGWQINYPNKENVICDAICHKYSYGHNEGLLEIMGLVDIEKVGNSVEGSLTADEVFRRIKKDWDKKQLCKS